MFQDAYVKLDKTETRALVERLNPSFDGAAFDTENAVIMARRLSFYKNSRFLDMADHRLMPPLRRYAILIGDEATLLDFTNAPIYELNRKTPVALNNDTILDYTKFFFSFVKGRHGQFIIVESVDDIPWREEPPPAARKAVGKMIAPVTLNGAEDGIFHLTLNMMFKDSLFQASVDISPGGQVNILDEKLLVEDIPVIDDLLGQ